MRAHAAANAAMIPQKRGAIVNIIANVFRGFPGMAHTGAARAGVENLTRTVSETDRELMTNWFGLLQDVD